MKNKQWSFDGVDALEFRYKADPWSENWTYGQYGFDVFSLNNRKAKVKIMSVTTPIVDQFTYWSIPEIIVTREGYEFEGWYNGDNLVNLTKRWEYIDETMTLVAHWKKI